jgi:hypothetical protein
MTQDHQTIDLWREWYVLANYRFARLVFSKKDERQIQRKGIPFGAPASHTDVPTKTQYPYAELFHDFAAAVCRPNAVVVTYGYGFGDDHVNRVLLDMLTIPSTHLVIIAYVADDRLQGFCAKTRAPQVVIVSWFAFCRPSYAR